MQIVPVLVRPLYAGNAGSAVRVAANFGLDELVLVQPSCSTEENEFRQMAVGGLDHVRIRTAAELTDAVADCDLAVATTSGRQRDPRGILVPDQVRTLLDDRRPARVALVFGSERSGLSAEELRHCHVLCTVPSAPDFPVLNLAQAVAILLAAVVPGRRGPEPPRNAMDHVATTAEFEAALAHLQEVLLETGFLDADNPTRVSDQLRRLVGRAVPTSRELAIVRGIAAHIRYIWGLSSSSR